MLATSMQVVRKNKRKPADNQIEAVRLQLAMLQVRQSTTERHLEGQPGCWWLSASIMAPTMPDATASLLPILSSPAVGSAINSSSVTPVRIFSISVFCSTSGPETHLFSTETGFDNGVFAVSDPGSVP
jgi:hypothetical protein